MIENETGHEVNENDGEHQAGKQKRHAAKSGDDLNRTHAEAEDGRCNHRERRIDPMALRGETRRESDEQYRNDHQHVDHAGNAVELGAENRRFHGGKGYGNDNGQAEVDARMHQVFVEMRAPEFGFDFPLESNPLQPLPQPAALMTNRPPYPGLML